MKLSDLQEDRGIAPDIGSIVVPVEDLPKYREWKESGNPSPPYGLHQYRVTGWYCPRIPPERGEDSMHKILTGILWDSATEDERLKPCSRKDATHVNASGVAGLLRPIDEVAVVGRVNWKPEMIAQEKKSWNFTVAHDTGI